MRARSIPPRPELPIPGPQAVGRPDSASRTLSTIPTPPPTHPRSTSPAGESGRAPVAARRSERSSPSRRRTSSSAGDREAQLRELLGLLVREVRAPSWSAGRGRRPGSARHRRRGPRAPGASLRAAHARRGRGPRARRHRRGSSRPRGTRTSPRPPNDAPGGRSTGRRGRGDPATSASRRRLSRSSTSRCSWTSTSRTSWVGPAGSGHPSIPPDMSEPLVVLCPAAADPYPSGRGPSTGAHRDPGAARAQSVPGRQTSTMRRPGARARTGFPACPTGRPTAQPTVSVQEPPVRARLDNACPIPSARQTARAHGLGARSTRRREATAGRRPGRRSPGPPHRSWACDSRSSQGSRCRLSRVCQPLLLGIRLRWRCAARGVRPAAPAP